LCQDYCLLRTVNFNGFMIKIFKTDGIGDPDFSVEN